MNRNHAGLDEAGERMLDLLVDGELDSARRRELFSALEAAAGGWRRCALAFLEAQAWREDVRGAAVKVAEAPRACGGPLVPRKRFIDRLRSWSLLAMCTAFAFVAGWFLRPPPAGPVATAVGLTGKNPAVQSPSDETEASSPSPGSEKPAGMRMAGVLTLKFDDHGQERELQLPVLEGAGFDVRQWLERPPVVRAAAVKDLERRGHKVEAHRQLVTFNLKDGRTLVMPLDQVDVRYAHRVYQ